MSILSILPGLLPLYDGRWQDIRQQEITVEAPPRTMVEMKYLHNTVNKWEDYTIGILWIFAHSLHSLGGRLRTIPSVLPIPDTTILKAGDTDTQNNTRYRCRHWQWSDSGDRRFTTAQLLWVLDISPPGPFPLVTTTGVFKCGRKPANSIPHHNSVKDYGPLVAVSRHANGRCLLLQ